MIVLRIILETVGVFFGLPATIIGIWSFISDFHDFNNVFASDSASHGKVTKLKWKTLKSIYRISKWRWRYQEVVSSNARSLSGVKCLIYNSGAKWVEDDRFGSCKVYPYKHKDKIVRIQLSFVDYIKFLCAKKFIREKDLGADLIFSTAQEDIDKVRRDALAQIEENQKIMEELIDKQAKRTQTTEITLTLGGK